MCIVLQTLQALSPLRVACLKGSPPFVDVVQGQCVGLFADAFSAAAAAMNTPYTTYFLNNTDLNSLSLNRPICDVGSITPDNCVLSSTDVPSILFHTNSTMYDVGIAFAFADSQQLEYLETTVPIIEAYYMILLGEKYVKSGGDIMKAIFSMAVLHIVGVIFLITLLIYHKLKRSPPPFALTTQDIYQFLTA